jgi:hypothetical protein
LTPTTGSPVRPSPASKARPRATPPARAGQGGAAPSPAPPTLPKHL